MSVQQDVSARNISNSNKPGFLRYVAKFQATGTDDELLGTRPSVHTDFTPGPVNFTGNRLDMAIRGPGFFAVEGPGNGIMYSRSGVFELNSNGEVVTYEGFACSIRMANRLSPRQTQPTSMYSKTAPCWLTT